ncbi:MAG: AAA family ATPase [Candidatus Dormibacteria bacterium]
MRLGFGHSRSPQGHPVDTETGFSSAAGPGRMVGVTGAVGAPGRTFISVNAAVGLAQGGLSVCLLDADPRLGAVAAQLDLSEDRSLHYLAHESALVAIDDDLIDRHLQHFGPLAVLTGRFEPGRGGTISGEVFSTVTRLLLRRYRLLIVDLGPLDNAQTAAMAVTCQLVLWVVSASPLGADLFDRTVTSSLAAQLRPKPNLAIINGTGGGALVDPESALLRRYGISVVASVPHHRPASLEAEMRHRPAVMAGPLSQPLSRVATTVAAAALRPSPLDPVADGAQAARLASCLRTDGVGP